jgi:hypothetical protein
MGDIIPAGGVHEGDAPPQARNALDQFRQAIQESPTCSAVLVPNVTVASPTPNHGKAQLVSTSDGLGSPVLQAELEEQAKPSTSSISRLFIYLTETKLAWFGNRSPYGR